MSDEIENPQQQKPQPGGSVNAPDTKTDPLPGNPNQSNPREISKKTPSQDSDSPYKDQEKPADEKRRAS